MTLSRPGAPVRRDHVGEESEMRIIGRVAAAALLVTIACAGPASAQATLDPGVRAGIDQAVNEVLTSSGAPSASIAVVRDGAIVYAKAYGRARLDPSTPATPAMRYSIGSISKQFTAAAILLLAEEGRLTLDDPVERWVPGLTRGKEVTIRHLLSMTSGYQDFWPQDYVMPPMLQSITASAILEQWGKKPLDFDPGTRWQYSNTNYVIAGVIVEKAAGVPLLELLKRRVFTPLGMMTVADTDSAPLGPGEPERYRRFALGPPRPAPKEGKGWMFAAGELAMTASDLATWDISLMKGTVLKADSYTQLVSEIRLASGVGTGYGLGVSLSLPNGRRRISHGGEVSGFTAENDVYPDDGVAVVALTNIDANAASSQIADRIARAIFEAGDRGAAQAVDQAKAILDGLRQGRIDRALFTENANAYFDQTALDDFASSLEPLGALKDVALVRHSLRGGMVFRSFKATFDAKAVIITTYTMPDGRLEQYLVSPAD
jgi:CubicO group peptidase (beta-lactamase class C family)